MKGISTAVLPGSATAGQSTVAMMMHSALGKELEHVVVGRNTRELESVVGVDRLLETEREDQRLRNRSLLSVSATRARDQLVVTAAGSLAAAR